MRPTTQENPHMWHPHRVTRDLTRGSPPTVPSHAVPTRECQSIHRRCSGRTAAPGREDNHSTYLCTFCSMSEPNTTSRRP